MVRPLPVALAVAVSLLVAPASTALAAEPSTQTYLLSSEAAVSSVSQAVGQVAGSDAVEEVLPNVGVVTAELTPAEAASLDRLPGVTVIPDFVVTLDTVRSNPVNWGLDRIDQRALPLTATYDYPATEDGAGVTAYILDSGIRADHVELSGRVAAGWSAISDGRGTSDCLGHGTHVAGIVGGTNVGVASQVTLVPVRVFGCTGSGYGSDLIAGLNWIAADHQAGTPAVVNMSLGGGASAAMNAAVDAVIADGVTAVAAAGNSATDACTGSPANDPLAITVGAVGKLDEMAGYSNYGTCVDLSAPGGNGSNPIWSAGISSTTAIVGMMGTSMAAPFVAGVVARYLTSNSSATPAAVQDALNTQAITGAITGRNSSTPDRLLYAPATGFGTGSGPVVDPNLPTRVATAGAVLDGTTAAKVSWTPPASAGASAITAYVISVSPALSTGSTSFVASSSLRMLRVAGLSASTSYTFSVAARNASGTGPALSTPAVATPSVPGTPATVTGRASVGTITADWTAPANTGGSPITGYTVRFTPSNGGSPIFKATSAASRTLVYTTRTAGISYEVAVSAKNAVGVGPYLAAGSNVTSLSLPGTPTNLRLTATTSTSATVAWNAPANTGGSDVIRYEYRYTTNATTWTGWSAGDATTQAVLPDGVRSWTKQVQVRAVTAVGTGLPVAVRLPVRTS